jgi:tetratricopeptide (TPR) repeat protein
MSQAENLEPLKALFKAIAEISGYAAVLVSYILAISGRTPGQAPVSTSIATILITTIFVVGWRWRSIKRQNSSSSGLVLTLPASAIPPEKTPLHNLLEPIKRTTRKNYIYSLRRRRVESGILLGVTLLCVSWTGSHFNAALQEFSNPLLSCSTGGKKELRILIANIQDLGDQPGLLVEDRLYDFLSDYQGGQFEVCRWKEPISVRSTAKGVALSNGADMLIWGRRDIIYEIHLEVPAWESLNRTLSRTSSEEATSYQFQLTEWEHLGYVTEFAISEMIFLSGESALAQERLETALNLAKQADFAKEHKKDIAAGYFLLGLFYDPNTDSNRQSPQKAIDAYTQAVVWQDDLYGSVLNRGVIRASEGQTEDAIQDFSLLIDRDASLKGSAYINRAFLQSDPQAMEDDIDNAINFAEGIDKAEGYFFRSQLRLDREDHQGAIEDLKQAVALDPQGYYNYHMLGMVQLSVGQFEAARETYKQILPTLDEFTRQQVLDELAQVAETMPDLQLVIEEISAMLEAVKLTGQ